ncbi:hypothetical protein CR513_55489, partial [Mucuna pruriens]
MEPCATDEWVYMSTRDGKANLCYLDLDMSLSFDTFEANVFQTLDVAPSQLHPNGWVAMQAFCVICHYLCMRPIAPKFLHHYVVHVGAKSRWYKGFKGRFVKVRAVSGVLFITDRGRALLLAAASKVQRVVLGRYVSRG